MKTMTKTASIWFGVLLLLVSACSTVTNQGVEVGNPNLKGKALTLSLESGEETYVVEFTEADQADVTQVQAKEYETQPGEVSYPGESGEVQVSASFSDGTTVAANITAEENGEVTGVELRINGELVPVSFQTEEMDPPCPADTENAAITLATSLCSRIVACNTTYTCGECEAEVLDINGLASQFDGTLNMSLEEAAAAIDSGEVVVDEENLSSCLADMAIIPCDIVQEQFNDTDPPNYNAIREIIPKPSCAKGVLKGN